jgi:ferritin
MKAIKEALKAKNYTVDDAALAQYLQDLGLGEEDLKDEGLVNQIVDDILKSNKKSAALAKADSKIAKRSDRQPSQKKSKSNSLDRAVREHATELQKYIQEVDGAMLQLNNAAVHFLGDKIEQHFESFDRQVESRVSRAIDERPRLNPDDIEQLVSATMPPEFMEYWRQAG